MFSVKSTPRTNPARVPTTPIEAPLKMKMRNTMPREAPIVRKMAMSRPLSFTIMIMPEMMLKAATTMISVRIRNITLRSIATTLTMPALARCQSRMRACPPSAAAISRATRVVGADAADQRTGGGVGTGRHHLALDQRRRLGDAGYGADFRRDRIEIEESGALAVNREMAVETEDAPHQVAAKAVHHRHHDDQG